ncbi:MAG: lipoprotein [Gammaproteobacteria bacterium]
MRKLPAMLLIFLLQGCGMKGALYEPPPPAEPAEPATEVPVPNKVDKGEADRGERKTIPAAPEPAESR